MQNIVIKSGKRILVAMMLLATLLFAAAPAVFAQGMGVRPGGGGTGEAANAFSGKGVVVSTDPTGGTMVVTVDKGSRLLAQQSDFGKDVTFQVSKNAVIRAYGITVAGNGMVLLAPGGNVGPVQGRGGGVGAGKKLAFTDIQPGDAVFFAGTFDSASSQFTVNGILDWLY